jgi:hypothetical protein
MRAATVRKDATDRALSTGTLTECMGQLKMTSFVAFYPRVSAQRSV